MRGVTVGELEAVWDPVSLCLLIKTTEFLSIPCVPLIERLCTSHEDLRESWGINPVQQIAQTC